MFLVPRMSTEEWTVLSPGKGGRHHPMHKMTQENKDDIINHIKSFNPSISHYRRSNAPRPSVLTSRALYKGNV